MRNSKPLSLRPSAYLGVLCVEVALLTQRTPRYAEGRRVLESGPADALEIGAVRV